MTEQQPVGSEPEHAPEPFEPAPPEPGPFEPGPGEPRPTVPRPTVPGRPTPPSQPQPVPPEVPSPPDVRSPDGPGGAQRPPVPPLPHTDDPSVDAAIEELTDLTSRPLDEQVEVYVGVHRRLQDRLADLDG